MPATLVIGGQWGDEGKAKIVDYLARDIDYVVRYQGGANAGHTVVVDDRRYAFHLLPSGLLYPDVKCILGGGMVIDPFALLDEIDGVLAGGIDVHGRILISSQAHIVLPHHKAIDAASEKQLGAASIGTTKKGITPAYMDKTARKGVRMGDLLLPRAEVEDLLTKAFRRHNKTLRAMGQPSLPVARTIAAFMKARKRLQPLISDTRVELWNALSAGDGILFEGAQGAMLDIDHGTYPFVTSSSCGAGGAVIGAGVPPSAFDRIIGIFKAYCTRVGNGPFPTEDKGRKGNLLRDRGHEYGTTTGRPRRCGWFDAVAARTAVKQNGVTEIALTKLDVLDDFDEIKVCTSYRCGKKRLDYFPIDVRSVDRCKPHYEVLQGWKSETSCKGKSELPSRAASYVSYLEELVGCRINLVSLGPERSAMIERG